jgi:hypothetical protein
MRAVIWPHRIDILGAQFVPREAWDPLLNDLRAEHVPSYTPTGKRLAVFGSRDGQINAFVYRTAPLRDEDVIKVLAKHGISASIGAGPS